MTVRFFDKLIQSLSKSSFPNTPASWGFSPAPPAYITNPLISDDIYSQMESGWAKPVPAVKRITGPKSVEFADGTTLDNIDTIVYCTGYDGKVPFLKGDLDPYPIPGEQGNMYRNMLVLHPDKATRESLALVGHAAFPWPGFGILEMQNIALAQIWKGKSPLPPYEEMKKWHADLLDYRRKLLKNNKFESTFYPAMLPTADQLHWLDQTTGADLLSHFGWSWKAWKLWWQDRDLYNMCNSGVFSPSMWRFFEGPKRKAWSGARAQIKADNEAMEKGAARRKELVESKKTI